VYPVTDNCISYQDGVTGAWINVTSGCVDVCSLPPDTGAAAAVQQWALQTQEQITQQVLDDEANQRAQDATGFCGIFGNCPTSIPSPFKSANLLGLLLVGGVVAVAIVGARK
jgi:hypothetical protein